MSETWRILDCGEGEPAWNMAVDEALLVGAGKSDAPALRFYGWAGPAATFGYFQRIAEVEAFTGLRPLIRRPTGGGLVPHENDWTYSAAIPESHPWHRLKAVESYRRIHLWLRDAFRAAGVEAELAPCCRPAGPGQCFVGAERHDLIADGVKLAGAAQRRTKAGLLIQGSIQPGGLKLGRGVWEESMRRVAEQKWGIRWSPLKLEGELKLECERLAAAKYSSDDHNRRR